MGEVKGKQSGDRGLKKKRRESKRRMGEGMRGRREGYWLH